MYVDKTPYVKRLIDQGKFIFLSRPRRFGKSLLLSTIEAYFRGEKELFNGTWLGDNETEWAQYPVLHFDMSIACGNDVSMNPTFAACCGITQQEILDYFEAGISKFCEENGWTREKTLSVLKLKYDSYRFTKSEELVYNPYSLLLAFNDVNLGDYWIKSGTSKVFVDYLPRSEFDLLELQDLWVDQSRMEATYSSEDAIPLLFQTGYLTIKEFKRDEMGEVLYRLGLPNGEVRNALINQLMPKYMGISLSEFTNSYSDLKKKFTSGDVPGWIGIR